ncbi:uncharacterized protein ARMOST_17681 [Armillaria ostoyae]|uniref:DUF1771 domain-containing protein n=1 Tax=Armillaria ostoyae TaxID=47428 RepID=A0A284RZM9_ARMOS|nr:uncharacterized protein ARMOST_17681 [Armillaria ostoyae]
MSIRVLFILMGVLGAAVLLTIAYKVFWAESSRSRQYTLPVDRPEQHRPVYQPPLPPPPPSPYTPLLHQQHRPVYQPPPCPPPPSQSQSSPHTPPVHQPEQHQPVFQPPPHRPPPSQSYRPEPYTPPVHQPEQHQPVFQPPPHQPPPSQSYQSSPHRPPTPHGPPKHEDHNQQDHPNEYYIGLRVRANKEGDEMARCFDKRHEANIRGDCAAAKDLSKQGKSGSFHRSHTLPRQSGSFQELFRVHPRVDILPDRTKAHSVNTTTDTGQILVTRTQTARFNPHRRRTHTVPITKSLRSLEAPHMLPTRDTDNHATTDSSQLLLGGQYNALIPGDCTMDYGLCPRYARGYLWQDPGSFSRHTPVTTATWTETLPPMPGPPTNELNNHLALRTIKLHPALFDIVTPINITCFRELLVSHPNHELVSSVCRGLETGFWPWADTSNPEYPTTNDNSFRPLRNQTHADFIRSQRDAEIDLRRFSQSFGPDLLPGMHSVPVGVVHKPHSAKLRLIVDHSAGDFSPNSMIPKHEGHVHLDTLRDLGRALIRARRTYGRDVKLVLFKSDISQAYRQLPMHVLWQIRQTVAIDGQRHVDRCNNFGNRGAGRIWGTFFGLVLWIAIFIKMLTDIFCYVDDSFSWEFADKKTWYSPYHKLLPTKQALLLKLFDELGVPHEEEKQLYGDILTIIGFDVDPNAMTITMPISPRQDLIAAIRNFAIVGSRRPLHDFDSLAGWCNWSFNAYPLLRPGLSILYAKKHGKSHSFQPIWVSKALCRELIWIAEHLEHMPGILFLDSLEWGIDLADIKVQTDASSKGLGIWLPDLMTGFYSEVPNNADDHIFFNKALAVVSALLIMLRQLSLKPRRILIYTDNTNTVDMFNSLHAKPFYNPLLITAVDALIEHNAQLRVVHIPGSRNTIADALSRGNNALVFQHYPKAHLSEFCPPELKSGSDAVK